MEWPEVLMIIAFVICFGLIAYGGTEIVLSLIALRNVP